MNYLYDILLNYNDNPYDIFDWNVNDEIIHIRKIPLFKVQTNILYDLVKNKVILDNEFLIKIYKKAEIFTKNRISIINYAFILTDGIDVIGFKYHNNTMYYSRLLIDEEITAIEYGLNINYIDIKYDILQQRNLNLFKTRNERYMKSYILKELKKMIEIKDYDKLNYIYLEYFNKKMDNENLIYNDLELEWDNIYLELYNFLKYFLLKQ